jgi:hypothetical protein
MVRRESLDTVASQFYRNSYPRGPNTRFEWLFIRICTHDQQTIPANLPNSLRIKIRDLTRCDPYSYLRATMGSAFVARRAGT